MKTRRFIFWASVCVALIFAGLNIAGQNWLSGARLDMTENRLYTLSDSAEDVASTLAEPVQLSFVYSRGLAADYPAIRTYGARIRELLAEISARSNGNVIVKEIDPDPFSSEEERLIDAGVTSVPTDSGDPLYLAIVGRNSVDDEIVIPYLAPEREALLEYDLVKLISQLDNPTPPRLGVLTALPRLKGTGGESDANYILSELARSYEIVQINADFLVLPERLDALLIVHPPELSPRQQYLLEQEIMRTGRAFIALDPVSKASIAERGRRALLASNLGQLGTGLGIAPMEEVVIDKSIGLPVERIQAGRRFVETQPLFIAPPPANMSRDDPVTADLTRAVNIGAPGRMLVNPAPDMVFEPLIWSSKDAMMISTQLAAKEVMPKELMTNYAGLGVVQALAGRLRGRMMSSFTEDIPPFVEPEDPVQQAILRSRKTDLPHMAISDQVVDIILVSDTDIFDDSFYVSPSGRTPVADNAAFVLNALDNLSGSEALVNLRSRAPSARPMSRIDTMRDEARERLYDEQEALQLQLAQTEARLEELRKSGAGGGLLAERGADPVMNQVEAEELARFRAEAVQIRSRLREIEREFRADIDKLELYLAVFNIWIPPALAILTGFIIVGWRNRKKGRTR